MKLVPYEIFDDDNNNDTCNELPPNRGRAINWTKNDQAL